MPLRARSPASAAFRKGWYAHSAAWRCMPVSSTGGRSWCGARDPATCCTNISTIRRWGGCTHGSRPEYTVEVTAGQFVRLVARQLGVDVAVTVLDPLGKTVLEADRENGAFGPEAASFIGKTSGQYRVRISNGS